MSTDLYPPAETSNRNGAEPSFTATIKGILHDALELMGQQIAMVKAEIRAEAHKASTAAITLACAVAPLLLGVVLLCFTLVHLLHWATTPAGLSADPATIPLWGCYAIVAAAFLLIGGCLLGVGIYRLKRVHPVPVESVKAFEENIQWLMNQNPK